jgi:DNA helicase-2/ATP-dependent DNA helicase PcrA
MRLNQLSDNQIKLKLGPLNKPQKEAITSKYKRVLVLAGAGSGKTKVLTSRIAFLLSKGVKESSILAVTFTNKASQEMQDRVLALLDGQMDVNKNDLCMGTFHSVCNKLLREHSLKKNYQILDTSDQKKLIKNVLTDSALLDVKVATINELVSFISKSKNSNKNPEESKDLENDFPNIPHAAHIYKLYEESKESMNLLDFDDLMFKMVGLLENDQNLLDQLRIQFKHILVDEYQDTNTLQEHLLKLLLRPDYSNYLFVVGDDDQSIYGWRGAEVGNILNFDKTYKEHHIVKLEENYRSTQNILDASNSVIGNNKKRYGKKLFTNSEDGELINIYAASSPENESFQCAKIIKEHHENGTSYSDIAILYRANFISRTFETKLSEALIPYTILGGVGFWARMEIKDMLSFLSVINNQLNSIQTERNFTLLKGIGKKTVEKIRCLSKLNNISVLEAVNLCISEGSIKGKSAILLKNYYDHMNHLINSSLSPYQIINSIIKEFNIFDFYNEKEGKEKGTEREENINEMITFISNFNFNGNDLDEFFEMVALQQDLLTSKEDTDSVKLMTMHSAKGLEFPIVLIVGVEDGVFPSERSKSASDGLEEERRLMYVSMTRAMKNLYISYAPYRHGGQSTGISNFVLEVPEHLVADSNVRYPRKIKQNFNSYVSEVEDNLYNEGDTIQDDKFGEGIILAVKKIGTEFWITVDFDFIGKRMIKKIA